MGISLHLARDVKTDILGKLYPSENPAIDQELGYAASLVPFYQHNDGPPSMMGAKNLKQAVLIKKRSTTVILDAMLQMPAFNPGGTIREVGDNALKKSAAAL